jgi:hypothetical protein
MPEYENWKESLAGETKGWTIKYYKVWSSVNFARSFCEIMKLTLELYSPSKTFPGGCK